MAQASVLTDNDIRRVFRIIETTRHADRNRLAFVFSVYGGMRVGEIAAVKIKDVANQYGEARREIKLASDQTKGSHSRTVVLSNRVRKEIEAYLKQYPSAHPEWPLIRSQRGQAFSSLTLSMLFREIYELAGIQDLIAFRTAYLCDPPQCKRRRNAYNSEANGTQAYWDYGLIL